MVGVRMAAGPLEVCRLIAGIVAAIQVRSLLVGEQDLKAEDSGGRRPERLTGVEPAGRCWSPPGPRRPRHASTGRIYGHGALVIKAPIRAHRGNSRPKATLQVERGTGECIARPPLPRYERIWVTEPSGSSSDMNAHRSVLGQVHWSPHYRIGRHAA